MPLSASAFFDRTLKTPLHRQLTEGLREAILRGELAGGSRLLPSRGLARELGLSRNTVVMAFAQLVAEGYLISQTGLGTFVAPGLAGRPVVKATSRKPPAVATRFLEFAPMLRVDARGAGPFRPGLPDATAFPWRVWQRLSAYRTAKPASFLDYGDAVGYRPLREAIANRVRQVRGAAVDANNVIVVEGTQSALWLIAQTLLQPDDEVIVEDPGYSGARAAFRARGVHLRAVPVDENGLDAEASAFPRSARAAYATPSHQFPLGGTMSVARRLALLAWAERSDAYLIEDDYDSEFRYGVEPLPSLQALDTSERVIYVGTFSKVLSPALRLAYLVVPAHLIEVFSAARVVASLGGSTFGQAVLTDFIEEGHLQRHVRRMTAEYAAKRQRLVTAIEARLAGQLRVAGSATGLQLTALLANGRDDVAIAAAAHRRGLLLAPLSCQTVERTDLRGFVLGYASTSLDSIDRGVEGLAGALAEVR